VWVALPATAPAQTNKFYGQRISNVEFTGIRTVDTSLVRRVAGFNVGETFNSGLVQDAIRQLYALSLFEKVDIEAERVMGGVTVKVSLAEYPRVRGIYYEGNHRVKEGDLKEKVLVVPNQIVSPEQINQAKAGIKSVYKDKGYFFVQIEPRTEKRPDESVDLTFQITEGDKVKIKRVTILGAQQVASGKVSGQMSNKSDNWIRSGKYEPDKYSEDLKKIVTYYKKQGFIDAAVIKDTVFVNDTIHGLELQITVHEGRRFYFGNTTFSGYTLFSESALYHQLKFAPGDVFSDEKFEQSVAGIYSLLHNQGRLFAQVVDKQSPRDSVVDIHFDITENEPAQVRYVKIEGNDKTKDKVIRRELVMMPGRTYKRSDLELSIRNLMVMNYFETVEPDLQVLPNGDVDIVLNVKEKSTGQISVGGGYSGQDKFVGTLGFTVPNFMGNGQSVSVNAEKGSQRTSFDLSLTEPWFRDTRTSVGLDFFSLSRRSFDNNYNEERNGLGVRVGRRLRWPDAFTSIYLRGRLEDVGYSSFSAIYKDTYKPGITAGPDPLEPRRRLTSGTITLMHDTRNRAQFTTAGHRYSASFEYAGDAIGGYWHYHREIVYVEKFFPMYKEIALAARARWGFIWPTAGDDLVPFSEKFQVGGTNGDGLIRGYEEGTGGARSANGQDVPSSFSADRPGGFNLSNPTNTGAVQYTRSASMSIYSLELQLPIAPPTIYGLLFTDAGRGFSSSSGWRFDSDMWRSAGVGARMVVPGVGTIGFDIAFGFDDPTVGGWRPHFQIGRGL
jgi:outer membrane protein insertion porin family